MARKATELTALHVSRLKAPGFHAVGGVSGLYLQVKTPARTWILRAMMGGKRRDMGLGGYPDVTLAQARDKAREARQLIDRGEDPILVRREAKSNLLAAVLAAKTFAQCADSFLESKADEWGNAKHRQQWRNTLVEYAYPVIGNLLVKDVELPQVLRILEPIWRSKTETASRLRGRIESVLDWAAVRGYRDSDNPARWRGHLDKVLPKPTKVAKVQHHRAMAIDDVPIFFARLQNKKGTGARALELLILTALRSGEVRGARWSEIDLDRAEWVIPADRMKAGKEHRVPLSKSALVLFSNLPRWADTDLVFPSSRFTPLSDMTLTKVLRDLGESTVPHGFRSTFKDWASERTNYPNQVSELALAHTIESKVEAAYRRGDLLEKRRSLMNDWGTFCLRSALIGVDEVRP